MIPLYFGVALLCGMAIRRGITAVVIALVIGLALTIPLVALVRPTCCRCKDCWSFRQGSWPFRGHGAATGCWTGRPRAVGRLGLLLTGMFTLVVSWYAGYRAWSIRDVGPIAPPAVWLEAASAPLPADQNAADLYREAGRRLVGPSRIHPSSSTETGNYLTCSVARQRGPTAGSCNLKS